MYYGIKNTGFDTYHWYCKQALAQIVLLGEHKYLVSRILACARSSRLITNLFSVFVIHIHNHGGSSLGEVDAASRGA